MGPSPRPVGDGSRTEEKIKANNLQHQRQERKGAQGVEETQAAPGRSKQREQQQQTVIQREDVRSK